MKNDFNKKVIMVGPFPPPIHGMSNVNLGMKQIFDSDKRLKVIEINTSIKRTNKNIFYHILRIRKIIKCLLIYCKVIKKDSITYLSVGGGLGTAYDIFFVLINKIYNNKLILHHHSRDYIDNYKTLHGFLFFISGKSSLHICLCNKLAKNLIHNYKYVIKTIVLSNSIFIKKSRIKKSNKEIKNVGFFSNITAEKGIFIFIETIRLINEKKLINGIIAGPILDKSVSKKFFKLIDRYEYLSYEGPIYGYQKSVFFNKIDLLLFPSWYFNEAEPISVLESHSFSTPVIAIDVGCLSEMISDKSLLFQRNNFSKNVSDFIINLKDNNAYEKIQHNARRNLIKNRNRTLKNLDLMFEYFY